MSWTKYFELDQAKFKDMYTRGQTWGELITYSWVSDSTYLYGAGYFYSSPTTTIKWSDYIPIKFGMFGDRKAEVVANALIMVGINTTGSVFIFVEAYRGGKLIKPEAWGAGFSITAPPNRNTGIPSSIKVSIASKKLEIYLENTKVHDIDLGEEPDAIRLGVMISNVSGTGIGLMYTYVAASFYDMIAGIVASITNVLQVMVWVMIGVAILSLVIGAFRRRRRKEEARGGGE